MTSSRMNEWVLEEDADSDFDGDAAPPAHPKRATRMSSGARKEQMQSHIGKSGTGAAKSSSSSSLFENSNGRYSADSLVEFPSDIDVEELPYDAKTNGAKAAFNKTFASAGQNTMTNPKHVDQKDRNSPVTTVMEFRGAEEIDKVTVEDLREAFDEVSARRPGGGEKGNEIRVDKMDLARAIRFMPGASLLANDIISYKARNISWGALLIIAKPYTGRNLTKDFTHLDRSVTFATQAECLVEPPPKPNREIYQPPAKPSREVYDSWNIDRSSVHNGGADKRITAGKITQRLSVASLALDSDEEEDKNAYYNKTLRIGTASAVNIAAGGWASSSRPPRVLEMTKSMEQEQWKEEEKNKAIEKRNMLHSSDHRRDRTLEVMKSMEQESWHDQDQEQWRNEEENSQIKKRVSSNSSSHRRERNRADLKANDAQHSNDKSRKNLKNSPTRSNEISSSGSYENDQRETSRGSINRPQSQSKSNSQSNDPHVRHPPVKSSPMRSSLLITTTGDKGSTQNGSRSDSKLSAIKRELDGEEKGDYRSPSRSPQRDVIASGCPSPIRVEIGRKGSGTSASKKSFIASASEGLSFHTEKGERPLEKEERDDISPVSTPRSRTSPMSTSPTLNYDHRHNSQPQQNQYDRYADSYAEQNRMLPLNSSWETTPSQQLQEQQSLLSPKLVDSREGLDPPPRPPRQMEQLNTQSEKNKSKQLSQHPQALSDSETNHQNNLNLKKNTETHFEENAVNVKRSISWSTSLVSTSNRPPRPKSTSSAVSSSVSSIVFYFNENERKVDKNENAASADFGSFIALPALSKYAIKTGVIIEGWLEKKSSITGFWQKRYFVLSESTTDFCVLRIYYKVVESSWGTIPLKMKAIIPIGAMQSVSSVSSKIKQGRQFSLLFSHPDNKSAPLKFRKSTTTEITNGSIRNSSIAASKDMGYISTNSSEWGDSDPGLGEESSKAMVLKAETLQMRLLWVTMLEKVINLRHDKDAE